MKPLPRSLRNAALLAWGGVMRDLRAQRGWTLGKLATRAGLSRHALFLIEKHERLPHGDTTVRVSQAFAFSIPTAILSNGPSPEGLKSEILS